MDPDLNILKTYVVGQARLGYAEFNPGPSATDVILATYPKSGSTWTSFLLHSLRSGGDEDFDDIKNEVIDITPGHWDPQVNPFLIEQRFSPRTFKTHGSYPLAPKGGRFIYIARDPRDAFVSLYHFLHDLFALDGRIDLHEFYQQYYVDRFGSGHDIGNVWNHFLSWHPHREDEDLLWLHYEDLLQDRKTCLRRIARFMGIDLSNDLLELVLTQSQIGYSRKLAPKLNPSQNNRVGRITRTFGSEMSRYASNLKFGKVRKGVAGEGRIELPASLVEEMDREWRKRITPALGYANYEEMLECCSLLRNHEPGQ